MARFPIARAIASALTSLWAILAPISVPPSAAASPLQYVSPLPGSDHVLPGTNIIVRPGDILDAPTVTAGDLLIVSGSASGDHAGRLRLSDDGRTITFRPTVPFDPGEVVTWRIAPELRADSLGETSPASFQFTIAGRDREALRDWAAPLDADEPSASSGLTPDASPRTSASLADDPLPTDLPRARATALGAPCPGRIFLAGIHYRDPTIPSYLMILENDGTPGFYRKIAGLGLDFKPQPDGRVTYFDTSARAFYALDSTFAVVDSFRCGNGYTTDLHELQILPNGHALLMAYDPQIVDMSLIIPKGLPAAVVVGLIIQELDRDKEVVFQWRSWDHFKITDVVGIGLGGRFIDYVHGNSIEATPDGNLVISSRHMDEVTKIDRATGEILWRLGGRNNQFEFLKDPIPFSRQHDARVLPNGNIMLFDNGNTRVPSFSRAVEYAINEKRMTARLVWEYRHEPDVFGAAGGSAQRLPNGNTLIGWGFVNPTMTEVTADGKVAHELTFDPGIASYRVLRYEWPASKPANVTLSPETLNLGSSMGDSTGGGWVSAAIESDQFDVSTIDVATVRLAGSVPADANRVTFRDRDANGVPELTLRFSRVDLAPLLGIGENRIDVSGLLTTKERFRGWGEIKVAFAGVQTAGAAPAREELVRTHTLAVYDVQGRLIRRWRATLGPAGRIAWDGRGWDGRLAPSGIYFVRIEDVAGGRASKVVIAR